MKNKFITFRASDGHDRILHLRKPIFCITVLPSYTISEDTYNIKHKEETFLFSIEKQWHEAPESKYKFIMAKAAAFYSKYRSQHEGPGED